MSLLKLQNIWVICSFILVLGCGGGGGSAPEGQQAIGSNTVSSQQTMSIGRIYTVNAGDQVIPIGETTPKLKIIHEFENGTKQVQLLEGKAILETNN